MLTNAMFSDAHTFCQITACGSKSKGPTLRSALRPVAEVTTSDAAKPRMRHTANGQPEVLKLTDLQTSNSPACQGSYCGPRARMRRNEK